MSPLNKELPWNSYFGASLCTADVNGDGLDDLIVGAPMFSPKVRVPAQFAVEVGAALLFLGNSEVSIVDCALLFELPLKFI